MFRHTLLKLMVSASMVLAAGSAFAENRVALVIGQSAYRSVPALPNPANDARAVTQLLTDSGFDIVRLETGEFLDAPHPEFGWVTHLLKRYNLSHDLRGDGIYTVARKAGPVKHRWPAWLYS